MTFSGKRKSLIFFLFSIFCVSTLMAVGSSPRKSAKADALSEYYSSIDWTKRGSSLKSDLNGLIKDFTNVSYKALYDVYETTDNKNGYIWDMYSNENYPLDSLRCGNYSAEGDCYNREHTIPQSVFNENSPMVSDAFHVYPTDGYVNNRRSNYPHGEVGSATYTSNNGSKLGSASSGGGSGTVFEPIDEYKGDFARTYFYFVTCYEDKMGSDTTWKNYAPFSYGSGLGLSSTYLSLYLKWARQDPVSQKEIDRNNAVYAVQNNRNPYIDYPGAVAAVFNGGNDISSYGHYPDGGSSSSSSQASSSSSSQSSSSYSSSSSSSMVSSSSISSSSQASYGDGTYTLITKTSDLETGKKYLIASGMSGSVKVFAGVNGTNGSAVNASISSSTITLTSSMHPIRIDSGYTLYDTVNESYVICGANSNRIASSSSGEAMTISFSSSAATIKPNSYTRTLQWNSSASIFRFYSSSQGSIYLFKENESDPVDSYASKFLEIVGAKCVSSASSTPSSALLQAWANAYTQGGYDNLSSSAKASFKNATHSTNSNLGKCVTLYDYILNKYGNEAFSSYYGDYMGRNSNSFGKIRVNAIENESSSPFYHISIAISAISFTILVGVIVYSRKKAR